MFKRTTSVTRDDNGTAQPDVASGLDDVAKVQEWPELSLTDVLETGDQRAGTIDGNVVAEGEQIKGVTVKKVVVKGERGIEFEFNGETRFLPVGGSAEAK